MYIVPMYVKVQQTMNKHFGLGAMDYDFVCPGKNGKFSFIETNKRFEILNFFM